MIYERRGLSLKLRWRLRSGDRARRLRAPRHVSFSRARDTFVGETAALAGTHRAVGMAEALGHPLQPKEGVKGGAPRFTWNDSGPDCEKEGPGKARAPDVPHETSR